MGRPEAPVPREDSALGKLALYLRGIRGRRALTYEQLEALTGVSASSLSRAAGGRRLPTLAVALAFNRACAGSEDVRELWKQARREVRQMSVRVPAPRPELIFDRADLSAALLKAFREGEATSVRDVEQRAEVRAAWLVPLSRSTVHRIVSRQAIPTSLTQLRAFLWACGVPVREHRLWELAWTRVKRRAAWEESSPVVASADAVRKMRAKGFQPLEDYRGAEVPWTCRCTACHQAVRVRLTDVLGGRAECIACARYAAGVVLAVAAPTAASDFEVGWGDFSSAGVGWGGVVP